jgi:NaMN:DMB phosphoribosyltransferase
MRKSRVLLAGVAVAAAAAATSAFTASNTLNDSVAGYDAAVVSGVVITTTTYVPDDGGDIALIDSIDFVATGDIEDQTATLQFRDALGAPVGAAITCTMGTYSAPSTPISCPTPDKALASFVGIGLTVVE